MGPFPRHLIMHEVPSVRRAGPLRWGWLAAFVLSCALSSRAAAQAVPDTVPHDTAIAAIPPEGMAPDTLPADSLMRSQDSTVVTPSFPRFPEPTPVGFAFGSWEWGEEALAHYHGFTLLQLLQRVPGLTLARAGQYGAPIGVGGYGLGGGRVRVFRDGFELDPLGFTAADLQGVGLSDVASVRVEQGPAGIVVRLNSIRLTGAQPLTVVHAATGTYGTNFLHATFARAFGRRNILTAGYDLSSNSPPVVEDVHTRGSQSGSLRGGHLSWSYAISPTTGLQLDFGTSSLSRSAPLPISYSRRHLALRARSEVRPGLFVDAMVGRNSYRPQDPDTIQPEISATQAALRAELDRGPARLEATARLRGTDFLTSALPGLELSAAGTLRPFPWLTAEARATHASALGISGTALQGGVKVGLVGGLSAFASLGAGHLPVGLVRDSVGTQVTGVTLRQNAEDTTKVDTVFSYTPTSQPVYATISGTATGLRAGAEWARGTARLGAAFLTRPSETVVPFGVGFDRGFPALQVGPATGYELFASVPVPGTNEGIRLEGWFSGWADTGGRPYTPSEQGRLSAILHGRYFYGQLEPTLRVEGVYRGASTGFLSTGEPTNVPAYGRMNLSLEIRIIEVQAFLEVENLLDQQLASEVPGYYLPNTLLYYGIRWTFRN